MSRLAHTSSTFRWFERSLSRLPRPCAPPDGPAIGWCNLLLLAAVWALLISVVIASRYLFPPDETRYLAVAWEMWLRGDFLVPHLNGEYYSHKPPLLFWLIHLGWLLFGVNEWWPRLMPGLFGLGALWLVGRLALAFWPERPVAARLAPWVLFSTTFWTLFSTAVMFDVPLVTMTLAGLYGIWWAHRDPARVLPWLAVGCALGAGALLKGPFAFVYLVPVALLAPWWADRPATGWRAWYLGLLGSIALGGAIGLAWAIPAALSGGEAYAREILWGQIAGRVSQSFSHARPWWFYIAWFPALLLPWSLWPSAWAALRHLGSRSAGVRFCLAWILPPFLVFSFASGKQVHYLLPMFPAFALLLARALADDAQPSSRWARAPLVAFFLLGGIALLTLPHLLSADRTPWIADLGAWGASAFVVAAGMVFSAPGRTRQAVARWIAGASLVCVLLLHLTVVRDLSLRYDVRPTARKMARIQGAGWPTAFMGKYRGEYHFAGRLSRPFDTLSPGEVANWFHKHPKGYVLGSLSKWQQAPPPIWQHPYRSGGVGLWDAASWRKRD